MYVDLVAGDIPSPEITRDQFVGRHNEIEVIGKAIQSDKNLQVVNIQGVGGIGKTSILRQIRLLFSNDRNLVVSDIIDFFDISTNTPQGFLDELVQRLPPSEESYFEAYKIAREKADELELAGHEANLTEAHIRVFESFGRCFNQVSEQKRVVLLIDTFELVQNILGQQLADLLKELQNSTVIIAGRENKKWHETLRKSVGDSAVYIELTDMDDRDAKQLLALAEFGKNIDTEQFQKLQFLTEGRPILLILAIDREWPGGLRKTTLEEDDFPEFESSGEDILGQYPIIEKYNLGEFYQMSENKIEAVREAFRKQLVSNAFQLQHMSPVCPPILIMALAYKYLTAEMLAALMEVSPEEGKKLLDEIAGWTFVKYDKNTESYWLHDLVRELVMCYSWPQIDPVGDVRKEYYENIVRYYEKMLDDITYQENILYEERKKAKTGGLKKQALTPLRKLLNLKKKRQCFKAHQLYYHILADEEEGLKSFREVFVNNIWVKQWDANNLAVQERNTALKHLGRTYPGDRALLEEAMAEIVKSRYEKGLSILERLITDIEKEADPYLYGDILLYQGIAISKSEPELAEQKFFGVIDILKKMEGSLEHPEDPYDLDTRRLYRSLARCYGNLGYCYLMAGRLSEAIEAYRLAIPYCNIGKIKVERATFLNELGSVYSYLGDPVRGRFFWEEGLEIRENLLFDYHIALSYNSRGMIEYIMNNPYEGIEYSRRALEIFERIDDQRGVGLAHRALGSLWTRMFQKDSLTEYFKKAKKHLLSAQDIFKPGGHSPEPIYIAEVYEKLGILFRHYRNVLQSQAAKKNRIAQCFETSEKYFKDAITIYNRAGSILSQALVFEGLSRLYFESDQFEIAEQQLDKMAAILSTPADVPESLINPEPQRQIPMDEIEFKRHELVYPAGKLERAKARIAFEKYRNSKATDDTPDWAFLEKAARHYTLACYYLEKYSREAYTTQWTFKEIPSCLQRLSKEERTQFIDQIGISQKEYGIASFPAIWKWVENAEVILESGSE